MTKRKKILFLSVAALFLASVSSFFWRAHADRRSTPGHIVRFFRGEGGLTQELNDLAEDIRKEPSLEPVINFCETAIGA